MHTECENCQDCVPLILEDDEKQTSVEEAAEIYDENVERQIDQSNSDSDESENEEDEFQPKNNFWGLL